MLLKINVDLLTFLFQGELPNAIVYDHKVGSNVTGCHESRRAWVPIVGETFLCQMEPESLCE